jgi:hypothetical protein
LISLAKGNGPVMTGAEDNLLCTQRLHGEQGMFGNIAL